jgi:hypothetical protein
MFSIVTGPAEPTANPWAPGPFLGAFTNDL